MNWKNKRLAALSAVALLLLVGCGRATPPSDAFVSPLAAATDTPKPAPLPEPGTVFWIKEPLSSGDRQVSGSGPKDVSIVIADVTLMGETLGAGRIGPDGQFSIPVSPPLIVNHRIGIMLDPKAPASELTPERLAELEQARGDFAIQIPHIGMIYDAASVVP